MRNYLIAGLSLLAALASSCGTCSTPHDDHTPLTTFSAQVSHGAQVYSSHCAGCHGKSGQGKGEAPRLVGNGAFADYDTALDVAKFVTENMPPKASHRRHITGRDYWAVLAFALSANGVKRQQPVGPDNAAAIVLNR